DDGEHLHLETELLREGTRHDDDLMPAIDRLCKQHNVRPADLGRIAISIGPGGYTSLRIPIPTPQMLPEATGAAVVPIPSAAVAAWCLPISLAPALVCLASKSDSAYGVLLPPGLQVPPKEPAIRWWRTHGSPALRAHIPEQEFAEFERRLT